MTASTTHDAFARLPEELRIQIIKLSPDPWSLRNLTHASPAMDGVLDRYPLEILDGVLERDVPVLTRRLMGAVLEARLGRFPASLSEAKRVAATDSVPSRYDMPTEDVDTQVNTYMVIGTDDMRSLRLDRAAAAVRYLLAAAENVHAWSHACLDYYIERSMEMRPSTFIEYGPGRTYKEMFEKAECCKDYVPQRTGPPSWVEGQRMIKAFWRLQFLMELQGAGNKDQPDTL